MSDRLSILAELRMAEKVMDMEHVVASCLLDDPFVVTQRCRAANLAPADFLSPLTQCAALSARIIVDLDAKRLAATPLVMCRVLWRVLETRRVLRGIRRSDVYFLWAEGKYHRPALADAIERLSNIHRRLCAVDQHRRSANEAMNAAWRACFGEASDRVQMNHAGRTRRSPGRPIIASEVNTNPRSFTRTSAA